MPPLLSLSNRLTSFGSRPLPGGGAIDPDAAAWLAAIEAADGEELEPKVKEIFSAMVAQTKAAGQYNKIFRWDVLGVARTLDGALIPFKGDTTQNVNFDHSDYSRSMGLKGDGATKSLNTGYVAGLLEGAGDNHLSVYVSEPGTGAQSNAHFAGDMLNLGSGYKGIFKNGSDIWGYNNTNIFRPSKVLEGANKIGFYSANTTQSGSQITCVDVSCSGENNVVSSTLAANAALQIFCMPWTGVPSFHSPARILMHTSGLEINRDALKGIFDLFYVRLRVFLELGLDPMELSFVDMLQLLGLNIGVTAPPIPPLFALEPEVEAWSLGVEFLDDEELEFSAKQIVNAMVVEAKAAGEYDNIERFDLFGVARTLEGALFPLKGGAASNTDFVQGDYDRANGLKGDGVSKEILTGLDNFTAYRSDDDPADDNHISVFVTDAATVEGYYAGSSGNRFIERLNDRLQASSGVTTEIVGEQNATGWVLSRRNNANDEQLFVDGDNATQAGGGGFGVDELHRVFSNGASPVDGRILFHTLGRSVNDQPLREIFELFHLRLRVFFELNIDPMGDVFLGVPPLTKQEMLDLFPDPGYVFVFDQNNQQVFDHNDNAVQVEEQFDNS